MYTVLPYSEDAKEQWDEFCTRAPMATFLHTRAFLAYHGSRFRDLSAIILENGDWVGVIPAAESPHDPATLISHPGISYGGVIHTGSLRGGRMVATFTALAQFFKSRGYRRLIYKSVPHIYHQTPSDDDIYAGVTVGGKVADYALSCAIDLERGNVKRSKRRVRSIQKALHAGAKMKVGSEHLREYWSVLEDNLASRHDASPTHSFDEISTLADQFPRELAMVAGLIDGRLEGGILLFQTPTVHHAQYIACTERGRSLCVLDAVFDYAILRAREMGVRFFDFGTSMQPNARTLNDTLYDFKCEFGASGVVHQTLQFDLVDVTVATAK